MEVRKLTKEELLEADAYFNMASLLGKSIQAAAHQVMHPEGDPDHLVWLDKPELSDDDADPEEEPEEAFEDEISSDDSLIHSNEGNIEHQISQIVAMYTPGLYEFIKPSALCEMFHLACTRFNFDLKDSDPSKELSDSDKQKAAIAWIIAKRVFAVRHPDETLYIISFTERLFRESKAVTFRPMDDTDKEFVVETCDMLASGFESDEPIKEALEQIELPEIEEIVQIRASASTKLPISKAFWTQPEVALKGRSLKDGTPLDVFGDGSKPARIIVSDSSGGPVEITAFDMSIEAACGQMWQENNNSPFTASAATIYRKCAGLDSGAAVSQNTIERTVESILKLAKAWVYIAYDIQLQAFLKSHKKRSDRAEGFNYKAKVMDGNMLSIRRNSDLVVSPNGRIISGNAIFTITSMPIIYEYSYGFKQLMEVDNKYIGEALTKATPDNIPFARYIQTQINAMKSSKKENGSYNQTLTFEKIARRSTYDISNRAKLRNFQKKVMDYAQNLVAMGQIKAAQQHYTGKKYTGIDFIL